MDRAVPSTDQDLPILDPSLVSFKRDTFGRLVLTVGEQTYESARPARCYPISDPDRYITIFDGENQQVGLIEDVRRLDADSREVLADELELVHLTTQVLAIRSVTGLHSLTTWEFDTDRGPRTVYIKERDDVRRMPPRRVLFTDANEMRFEIRDTANLDARSAAFLDGET